MERCNSFFKSIFNIDLGVAFHSVSHKYVLFHSFRGLINFVDIDELDDNEEIPIFAVQNNYRYALEHPVKTYSFWLCTFLFTSIVLH